MPAATAPVRVPAQRRARSSVSSASGHAHSPGEIAHLSLAEVRDRLARNERVLNSALFSTSPTAPRSSFPNGPNGPNGPNSMSPIPRDEDPVRARLLAVRAQLCAREAELLADGVASLGLEPSSMATSPPTRSAKANALAAIRLGEANQTSHVALPIDSTLALGERDFDQQWAARFASATIDSPSSSRAPSGRGYARGDSTDALERSQAAARRARARIDDDDSMFDTDESYAAAGVYASQRDDLGNGLPLATARARREEGYDDDMSEDDDREGEGEEGGEWPEGNDEYDEIEGGHPEYGVAPQTEGVGVRV